MRVQLAQQAQEILGQSALVSLTERVDEVALLIGHMVTRGVPEVLDRPSPRHGPPRGRSGGWTAVLGLASILTEGDHRQVAVAASITGLKHPLSQRTAPGSAPLDVRADRRRHVLQHVSQPTYGHQSAGDVQARSLAVYAVPQDVLRGDATTGAGAHEVTAGGLGPCGQRKDAPTRPHSTVMLGS